MPAGRRQRTICSSSTSPIRPSGKLPWLECVALASPPFPPSMPIGIGAVSHLRIRTATGSYFNRVDGQHEQAPLSDAGTELMPLTHLNERGEARMVDIGDKAATRRRAVARARLEAKPETI